ncbi:hypothetical protein D3C77_599770 [compost metagenome]
MAAQKRMYEFVLRIKDTALTNTVRQGGGDQEEAERLIKAKFPGRDILSVKEVQV